MLVEFTLKENKIFAFNFAAEYLFKAEKNNMLKILEYTDFLFCNKEEAIVCA